MQKNYSYFQTPSYGEKNNCTVRAFQNAFGTSYEEAYQLLKAHGRKDGKGFLFNSLMYDLKGSYKGIPFKDHYNPRMTVGRFVNTFTSGIFILRYRGHVFAVIDGVIHDSFRVNPNKRVLDFYSIGSLENPIFQKPAVKKSQKDIVIEYFMKGFRTVNEVVAQTGLKKANVAWYFSKLKLN